MKPKLRLNTTNVILVKGKMKKLTYKVVVTDPYEDDNADDEAYETETVY